jgi:hypothetical protein
MPDLVIFLTAAGGLALAGSRPAALHGASP